MNELRTDTPATAAADDLALDTSVFGPDPGCAVPLLFPTLPLSVWPDDEA
jgi:hypothetical protein